MKIRTSLTLSENLLKTLDRLAGPNASRSAFVETILRDFVEVRMQAKREARAIAEINRHCAQLNSEMSDVLSFQSALVDDEAR